MESEKVTYPIHMSPRCGAYARTTGNPCKSPAMKNGRCRMHGGKTPIKHGLRSKFFKRQQDEIKELLQILEI
jgi:hypothetical protein